MTSVALDLTSIPLAFVRIRASPWSLILEEQRWRLRGRKYGEIDFRNKRKMNIFISLVVVVVYFFFFFWSKFLSFGVNNLNKEMVSRMRVIERRIME